MASMTTIIKMEVIPLPLEAAPEVDAYAISNMGHNLLFYNMIVLYKIIQSIARVFRVVYGFFSYLL